MTSREEIQRCFADYQTGALTAKPLQRKALWKAKSPQPRNSLQRRVIAGKWDVADAIG